MTIKGNATYIVFVILSLCVLGGCSHTRNQSSQVMTEWLALDEFHMVMAESYHPYMDSGNLVPARKFAQQMAILAEKWRKSKLPDKVNNPQVKDLLDKLSEKTSDFEASLTSVSDEELGKRLTQIHENFHRIQEIWYDE